VKIVVDMHQTVDTVRKRGGGVNVAGSCRTTGPNTKSVYITK
jgi:hypothetical protein